MFEKNNLSLPHLFNTQELSLETFSFFNQQPAPNMESKLILHLVIKSNNNRIHQPQKELIAYFSSIILIYKFQMGSFKSVKDYFDRK